MKNKILQSIGNTILDNLEIAILRGDDKMFQYFFETALWYDTLCLHLFGVELK
jgi:hypothetical protein